MKKYIIEDTVNPEDGKYVDNRFNGTNDIIKARKYNNYDEARKEILETFDRPFDFKIQEIVMN
jgi:hypothetical protein